MKDTKITLDNEKKWISECKADLNNFSRIYEAFVDDIYRYVFAKLCRKHEAEDITSQTFLKALEKIQSFKWKGISIKFWLFTIARNLIYRTYRKQETISYDERIESEAIDKKHIDEIVITEELKQKLEKYMFELDSLTREIITLRIWEECRFKEIAKLIGINEMTVKKRFYRGIEKLKQMAKKDRKAMKLALINIPIIFAGIESLKKLNIFKAESKFKAKLASSISQKINLFIKSNPMNAKVKQSKPTVEHPVSGVKKTLMKGTKSSKVLKIVITLVGTIAILGGGLGSYLWLKSKQDSDIENTTEDEDTKTSDPYAGWETYTYSYNKVLVGELSNETLSVTFKYPKDWTLEEEKGGYIENSLAIADKDGNKIKLFPIYDGGERCIYPDDPNYDEWKNNPLIYSIPEYKEIKNNEFTYRRGIIESQQNGAEIVLARICIKEESNPFSVFITPFNLEIYYELVDKNVGNETLDILDKILLSIEKDQDTGYEGWKKVELTNMGYVVMVPQTWDVKEEPIEYPEYMDYKAVFSDGSDVYELGLCNQGIGDCGICEYQSNHETLLTLSFLGQSNIEMKVMDCYYDPMDVSFGSDPISRTLYFSVKDIDEGNYQELIFGHSTDDTTSTIEQLQQKYTTIKKVLESMTVDPYAN